MFKIKIVSIGKTKEKWLQTAISEYEKRLSHLAEISWIFAKNDSHFIELVESENSLIALSPDGQIFNSLAFSQNLYTFLEKNKSKITFLIGGPNGLPAILQSRAKKTWSLSSLTFTHQLTRLILIEQIYRAVAIAENLPYQK